MRFSCGGCLCGSSSDIVTYPPPKTLRASIGPVFWSGCSLATAYPVGHPLASKTDSSTRSGKRAETFCGSFCSLDTLFHLATYSAVRQNQEINTVSHWQVTCVTKMFVDF